MSDLVIRVGGKMGGKRGRQEIVGRGVGGKIRS